MMIFDKIVLNNFIDSHFKAQRFASLDIGDTFILDENYYIKTANYFVDYEELESRNAIRLDKGFLAFVDDDTIVTQVDLKISVEEKEKDE